MTKTIQMQNLLIKLINKKRFHGVLFETILNEWIMNGLYAVIIKSFNLHSH